MIVYGIYEVLLKTLLQHTGILNLDDNLLPKADACGRKLYVLSLRPVPKPGRGQTHLTRPFFCGATRLKIG